MFNETPVLAAVRAMDNGVVREANLRALYEAAVKFSGSGTGDLCAFVRYLETLEENGGELRRGSVTADKNSVSILTVHASKGLEFPFVIIAGLTKRFNLSERSPALSVSHRYGLGLKRREPEKLKFYETLSSRAVKLSLKNENLSEEMRIYYVALTRAREKLFIVCAPKNAEKQLSYFERLMPVKGDISPFYVGSSASPVAWFIGAFMRHPLANDLRTEKRCFSLSSFPMEFKLVHIEKGCDSPKESAPEIPPDMELTKLIASGMNRPYRYLPVSEARSLHTASALKEEKFSEKFFGQSVPAFMYDSALTPADVGTATHKFLEFCDFSSKNIDVPAEINRLVSLSRLTPEEGASVDRRSIETFFSSGLFSRILRSNRLFREQSFTIQKSVRDFDPAIPKEFENETAVVRGQIDLVFIENGKAVIVDYKTDKVSDILIDLAFSGPYLGDQIDIYTEAVERAFGYEVKQRVIYSLTKTDFIVL